MKTHVSDFSLSYISTYSCVLSKQMCGRGGQQQHLSQQPRGSFQNHFGSFLFDRLVVVPPPSMSNELKIKLWRL